MHGHPAKTRYILEAQLALDAVIRSKLLYGLESAQLNTEHLHKLDVFHLKGLRKILKMDTTYIDRENTNLRVIQEANQQIENAGGKKHIVLFSEAYKIAKIDAFRKLLAADENDPVRKTTLTHELKHHDHANKRHGAPKKNWAKEAAQEYWASIQHTLPPPLNTQDLNLDNADHRSAMVDTAEREN